MPDMVTNTARSLLSFHLLTTQGPIIRIAPNEVAIADPNAIKTVYSINSGFTKASAE